MENRSHALLSASSSSRWLECTPSARLGEFIEDKPSEFAKEGTLVHCLCEIKLRNALYPNGAKNYSIDLEVTEEMEESSDAYVSYILDLLNEIKVTCKDPMVLIEQRLDYSRFVRDGFGTGDCVIVADDTLHIIDYKNGKGVKVDAYENPQMKLYALGALEIFDALYDINKVEMTIFQPRLSNVSSFTMTKTDLYKWANDVLKPRAELAYKGEGEFKCGPWCKWCKVKNTCKKRAEENISLAKYEFMEPFLLNDSDIIDILNKVDGLVEWANGIKDYALDEALKGHKWTGYKLVEGRSSRKFIDEIKVAEIVNKAGYEPYQRKLMTISELEKLIGKKKFNELVGNLVIKPQGKPTLVVESDKRPSLDMAIIDFKLMEEK